MLLDELSCHIVNILPFFYHQLLFVIFWQIHINHEVLLWNGKIWSYEGLYFRFCWISTFLNSIYRSCWWFYWRWSFFNRTKVCVYWYLLVSLFSHFINKLLVVGHSLLINYSSYLSLHATPNHSADRIFLPFYCAFVANLLLALNLQDRWLKSELIFTLLKLDIIACFILSFLAGFLFSFFVQ